MDFRLLGHPTACLNVKTKHVAASSFYMQLFLIPASFYGVLCAVYVSIANFISVALKES